MAGGTQISSLKWFILVSSKESGSLTEWQAYAPYHVIMQLKRLVTTHCSCFSDENVWNDLWGFQSHLTRALTGLSRGWRQQVWQELWDLSCEKTKFAVQFYSSAVLTAVPVHGSHSMDTQGMQKCREENGGVCTWVVDSSPCHLHREGFHWWLQNLSRWEFGQVFRTPLPAPAVSSPINLNYCPGGVS